ncbi:MAG: acetate---CoA ligase (ADP-forming) subunit beta [Desulfobacteraceae bacterium Eth-SRB2]|nr:MAG: acetate---CoA ligase (ADP-forming) subunit beta [Desulfobacteraceae bacterium Eth-SRB2]
MKFPKQILETVMSQKRTVLSEYESKQILSAYQIPVTREFLVNAENELIRATNEIGYPLVLKGSSGDIIHKTEQNLVRVDIRNDHEAKIAFKDIMAVLNGAGGTVLVQELVKGQRELVIGMTRDRQFGVSVMFGLGGIFTEILEDVTFRLAPLAKRDALDMMEEIRCRRILENIRGMEAADLNQLGEILIQVGQIGIEHDIIKDIDINPVIISEGKGIAADALIVLEPALVKK